MDNFDKIQLLLTRDIKPIQFMLAGVGYTFASWGEIPGISKILHGVNFMYSEDLVRSVIGHKISCCSDEACQILASRAKQMTSNYVAICGAITTTRYRRGDNHFYYRGQVNGISFNGHVVLDKATEADHAKETLHGIMVNRSVDENIVYSTVLDEIMGATK